MAYTREQELEEYRGRLWGLIPVERIARFRIERPSPEVIAGYKALDEPTPAISDVLDSLGMNGTIPGSVLRPVIPGKTVVGPALTLRYVIERLIPLQSFAEKARAKLADRDAYSICEPGDVMVIDAAGVPISCTGGLSAATAKSKNMAGNIVFGGVRDANGIRQMDYPVWAAHITPLSGKMRVESAELNGVVNLAGVQVRPGDLVIADDTGVVIVPLERTEEVLRIAQEQDAKERVIVDMLLKGASLDEMSKVLPQTKW